MSGDQRPGIVLAYTIRGLLMFNAAGGREMKALVLWVGSMKLAYRFQHGAALQPGGFLLWYLRTAFPAGF